MCCPLRPTEKLLCSVSMHLMANGQRGNLACTYIMLTSDILTSNCNCAHAIAIFWLGIELPPSLVDSIDFQKMVVSVASRQMQTDSIFRGWCLRVGQPTNKNVAFSCRRNFSETNNRYSLRHLHTKRRANRSTSFRVLYRWIWLSNEVPQYKDNSTGQFISKSSK